MKASHASVRVMVRIYRQKSRCEIERGRQMSWIREAGIACIHER